MTQSAILEILKRQRAFFLGGATRPLSFRLEMLKKLKKAMVAYEDRLVQALQADLGKPVFEAFAGETGFVAAEIDYALKNLPRWMKSQSVPTPLMHFPGKSFIFPEPFGNALIISPWNFPVQLALVPLVGAISAGNTAIIKPSSSAPKTSSILESLISEYFSPDYLCVIEADRQSGAFLLDQKFDLIFFTGSSEAGKTVMAAAAKNLTPVVMELSGKNPCIVDRTADLKVAARRIVWGKFFNSGQSCVVPDYVAVEKAVHQELVHELAKVFREFYQADPESGRLCCRIVNEKHLVDLTTLMGGNGNVVSGGYYDLKTLVFEPTLLDGVTIQDRIMDSEIFGPILPVIEFDDLDIFLDESGLLPKPLTVYLFSKDRAVFNKVLHRSRSGTLVLNDTVTQHTSRYLPFGGVGESGMGRYHGRFSFEAFTHSKGVMKSHFWPDFRFRYPPYRKLTGFLKWLVRLIS